MTTKAVGRVWKVYAEDVDAGVYVSASTADEAIRAAHRRLHAKPEECVARYIITSNWPERSIARLVTLAAERRGRLTRRTA